VDATLTQDCDPLTEGHRLDLIVGDIDHRRREPPMKPRDLAAHLDSQFGIQVGERFIEKKNLGLPDDRSPERDSLSLTARELPRLALQDVGHAENSSRLAHPALDLFPGKTLQSEPE
jgi:hypothetical protein